MTEPDLHNDRDFGQITIGRGTYLGQAKLRIFSAGESINIGRYCSIADTALISAGGNHRLDLPSTWPFDNLLHGQANPTRSYRLVDRPTTIGSDVWICDGALVGGGIAVAHGAVVGAGAVVFRDVPPYAIVAGNPARVLRFRFPRDIIDELLSVAWWDWEPDIVQSRHEWFYLPIEMFLEKCRGEDRRAAVGAN